MKNQVIVILLVVSMGSLYYGYKQKSRIDNLESVYASEKEALEKIAKEQQLQAKEFQKMAELAQQEAIVQRTICEEQLKALKK